MLIKVFLGQMTILWAGSAKNTVISLLSMKENPGWWRYKKKHGFVSSMTTGLAQSLNICVVLDCLSDFYESLLLHF